MFVEKLEATGEDDERFLRSEHRTALLAQDLPLPARKRKPLTPQQLEERRKKVRWKAPRLSSSSQDVDVSYCVSRGKRITANA